MACTKAGSNEGEGERGSESAPSETVAGTGVGGMWNNVGARIGIAREIRAGVICVVVDVDAVGLGADWGRVEGACQTVTQRSEEKLAFVIYRKKEITRLACQP
jgi:hypothetical protein